MDTQSTAKLLKLKDANLTVDDPKSDIRGRKVLDKDGKDVGTVDALVIDEIEHKVRLLEVESGGFLGLGATKVLIPVDAISHITDDAVHLGHTREHVAGAPAYDPTIVKDEHYLSDFYGYYGYMPYWGAGYSYPLFPGYGDLSRATHNGRA